MTTRANSGSELKLRSCLKNNISALPCVAIYQNTYASHHVHAVAHADKTDKTNADGHQRAARTHGGSADPDRQQLGAGEN